MPFSTGLLLPLQSLATGVRSRADPGLAALRHVEPGTELTALDSLPGQLLPHPIKSFVLFLYSKWNQVDHILAK